MPTVAISLTIPEGAQLEPILSLYCSANFELFPNLPSASFALGLSFSLQHNPQYGANMLVADSYFSARMHIPASSYPMPSRGIYCHWKASALDTYSGGPPSPWLLNTLDTLNSMTRLQSSLAGPVGLRVSAISQAARFLFLLPRA